MLATLLMLLCMYCISACGNSWGSACLCHPLTDTQQLREGEKRGAGEDGWEILKKKKILFLHTAGRFIRVFDD
jgi:hypothetical protein